jgi:hypothetical protein
MPSEYEFDKELRQIEVHKWTMFTVYHNARVGINKFNSDIANLIKNFNNLPPMKEAPSLIPYYELYPKWIREHPAMQTAVRALDRYNCMLAYKTRIHMLNIVAQYLFPIDDKLREIANYLLDARPDPVNSNIAQELVKYEGEHEISILPDDYYTDEEEMEGTIITAEMVRVWEKEDEEERKTKKREEGRAKRAAEEAKAAGMPAPKVDKAAEEKKKEEEEMKLMQEEQERLEEEKRAEEERIKQEEREKKKKKKLEYVEKRRTKREIRDNELREDLSKNALKGVEEIKAKEEKKKKVNEDEPDFDSVENNENQVKIQEEDETQFETRKRRERRERQLKYGKKVFEDKTEDIRSEKIEKVYEYIKKNRDISFEEKIKNIKEEYLNNNEINLHIYVSLMKTELFTPEQKQIISNVYQVNEPLEELVSILKKRDDERIKEYNLMLDLLDVASSQMETLKNYAVEDMYQLSLKEHDSEIQDNDDMGLKDVYCRPKPDYETSLRPISWSIPVDYYINDDGFWDNYIKEKQEKVDVRLFTEKPFIFYKRKIRRIVDEI